MVTTRRTRDARIQYVRANGPTWRSHRFQCTLGPVPARVIDTLGSRSSQSVPCRWQDYNDARWSPGVKVAVNRIAKKACIHASTCLGVVNADAESQGLGHNITACSMDFACTWPRRFSRLWRAGATPALQPPARGLSQRVLRHALFVHNVRLTHWRAGSKSSRSGGCGGAAQDGSSRQAGAPRAAKHALSVLDAATIVPTCAGACGGCRTDGPLDDLSLGRGSGCRRRLTMLSVKCLRSYAAQSCATGTVARLKGRLYK